MLFGIPRHNCKIPIGCGAQGADNHAFGHDARNRVDQGRLETLLANARAGIQFNKHVEGDGQPVFKHACRMGLEGIVSKRREHPYRSGRSKAWIKIKNPAAPGVTRFVQGRDVE